MDVCLRMRACALLVYVHAGSSTLTAW